MYLSHSFLMDCPFFFLSVFHFVLDNGYTLFPYPVYPDTGFPYLVKPYLVQPYPALAFLAAWAGVSHKSHTRCR